MNYSYMEVFIVLESADKRREQLETAVEARKAELEKAVEARIQEQKDRIEEAKVRFTSKMSSKVGYLVLAIVILPILIVAIYSINTTTTTMEEVYKSYAMNLAESVVTGIDFAVQQGENTYLDYAQSVAESTVNDISTFQSLGMTVDQKTLNRILGSTEIKNVEGSYAYLVSPDGTMLWHPDSSKIGNPVENAAVKGIVSELQAGRKVENGSVMYAYKGSQKLAGYAFTYSGDILIITADYDAFMKIDYDTMIGEISIAGVPGSYAYMVSPDGTMLYHSDASKIGNPVENAAVKGIVARLEKGEKVEPGAVIYEYKGANKFAGYALTEQGNVVVVTADYQALLAPVNQQKTRMLAIGIIMIVIASIVGVAVVSGMLKALEKLMPVIKDTAALNFVKNDNVSKLVKRKDEIGVMARELLHMQDSLRDIVGLIEDAGESINTNVTELQSISADINTMCSDNSATSQELAASMTETSAATEAIAGNVENMQMGAREIASLSGSGTELASEIMERATKLSQTTKVAADKTLTIYKSVKEKSDEAIEASKAVDKINELTKTIMSISSRTSLLALNASIEAARAGEAGRGFAVVASEIGSLAGQTSEAVSNITGIVADVNDAVDNMASCLQEIIGFLETNVIADYEEFTKVSVQYHDDADTFRGSMTDVSQKIIALNGSIDTIVQTVENINNMISDAASGITDIADKTSNMVSGTSGTADKVEDCKLYVEELHSVMKRFTLG